MNVEKVVLAFYTLCFVAFGVPGLLFPDMFSALLHYEFITPVGKMEFVAAYGGLIIGIGLYLLYCLKTNVRAGLVAVLTIVGSLFIGRVIGYQMGGEIDDLQSLFLAIESATVVIVGLVLVKGEGFRQGAEVT